MGDRSDFGSFGRYVEVPLEAMTPDMRDAYSYTMQLRGQVPGPHKIWLANPQLSRTAVPIGAYYQKLSSLSKAEIEIVTNVINGRWRAAYSNYEHEIIGKEAGKLPADKVEALIAGLHTSFEDGRQQVVYDLACTLAAQRVVPLGLYRKAKALLEDKGIVDVTMLMGWFTGVSLTLNAFDVPSNAEGLQQQEQQQLAPAAGANGLGGRLPLLDPARLNAEQKAMYDHTMEKMVPWAEKMGFQSTAEGGRLIGPFNPLLLSPGLSSAFLALQQAEEKHTTLDERTRQVVILAVGAVWKAPYEMYAHAACARKAGLSEESIARLVAGGVPDELSEKERIAARFTSQLTAQHGVDASLYEQAVQAFGQQGLVDMTYLAGCYHVVCGLLNVFNIPAPTGQWPSPPITNGHGSAAPHKPRLTTLAQFPAGSFLEQLAVRKDNSIVITIINHKQLWLVPAATDGVPAAAQLLCTFDVLPTGIVEVEPDVFLIAAGNFYTTHEAFLYRVDFNGWKQGMTLKPEMVFRFPEKAKAVNGSCLLKPGVMLVADCFAGLIWRVDIAPGAREMQASVWLSHESMGYFPGKMKPEQPGVNGVRYASRTQYLYYTGTAKKLLMRVRVDEQTCAPAGQPELVLAGRMGDDFVIDQDAGVLYLATHRQNSIDRVSLEPGDNSGFTQSVAGDPFTEELIGPSAGAWSRAPGDYGKVAFFLTDGGTASPAPCGPQPAKLLRLEF